MRIGIVTDVHDAADELATAIAALAGEGVDAVVNLGDATDAFGPQHRADEVVSLLRVSGAVSVWGNHDHGLCGEVEAHLRGRCSDAALTYFASARPRIELAGFHFSHVEPWIDAEDVAALWHFDGLPRTPELLARTFGAFVGRAAFVGHHHRWFATTATDALPWDGTTPLRLDPEERYLVAVAPVFLGAWAVVDTTSGLVIPHRADSAPEPT
jgi:hypothetical protein